MGQVFVVVAVGGNVARPFLERAFLFVQLAAFADSSDVHALVEPAKSGIFLDLGAGDARRCSRSGKWSSADRCSA